MVSFYIVGRAGGHCVRVGYLCNYGEPLATLSKMSRVALSGLSRSGRFSSVVKISAWEKPKIGTEPRLEISFSFVIGQMVAAPSSYVSQLNGLEAIRGWGVGGACA